MQNTLKCWVYHYNVLFIFNKQKDRDVIRIICVTVWPNKLQKYLQYISIISLKKYGYWHKLFSCVESVPQTLMTWICTSLLWWHSQISYLFSQLFQKHLWTYVCVRNCCLVLHGCFFLYSVSIMWLQLYPEHKLENFLVSKMGKPWISHYKYPTSISSVTLPLRYHEVNLYCWLYQSRHAPLEPSFHLCIFLYSLFDFTMF